MRGIVQLMVGIAALTGPLSAAAVDCRLERVVDGDTVAARCSATEMRLRLDCIDAPERAQDPWGTQATASLRQILPEQFVAEIHDTDQYGRQIAILYAGAERRDVNRALVRKGRAVVYDRYCDRDSYLEAEAHAREAGLGVWAEPGLQQRPWAYRHQQ